MSVIGGVKGLGAQGDVTNLTRFAPEPKSRLSGISFQGALKTVGDVVGSFFGKAAGIGGVSGIDPQYTELLTQQIEAQKQMMLLTFHSNIEKSKHETKMSAVRNVRVG